MRDRDFSSVGDVAEQVDLLFSDREVKLLLLWAVIAPAAGIAYLIWLKYPKLRLLSLLGFAIGLMQFSSQIGGTLSFLKQFGIAL